MRLLVMGDIHSNHIAFEKCINEATDGIDGIILTGDYVSDCPFPQKTMKHIFYLKKYFPVWLVKGNREDYQIGCSDGKLKFRCGNSSTGSLLYTFQNLGADDINFFKQLSNKNSIKIGNKHKILLFHGTPQTNREGLYPDTLASQNCMESSLEDIIICAHTHEPFIYEYKSKILINPGSIGLPLGSNGKSQYALLDINEDAVHVELKEQAYPIEKILEEFDRSRLSDMAPIYSKVIKMELLSGINYMPRTLYKARELMRRYGAQGDELNVPETCWEEAYRLLAEEREDTVKYKGEKQ